MSKNYSKIALEHKMDDIAAIKQFILAGKSIWTLQSRVTGKHYTYRCRFFRETEKLPMDQKIWWIDILAGKSEFHFLARLKNGEVLVKKGQDKTTPVLAVEWFLKRVWAERTDSLEQCNFFHMNQCGMCGRTLTTPESVKAGIGPECQKRLNAFNLLEGLL